MIERLTSSTIENRTTQVTSDTFMSNVIKPNPSRCKILSAIRFYDVTWNYIVYRCIATCFTELKHEVGIHSECRERSGKISKILKCFMLLINDATI